MFAITAKSTARKTVCKISMSIMTLPIFPIPPDRMSNPIVEKHGAQPPPCGASSMDTSTANPMAKSVRLIVGPAIDCGFVLRD